MIDVPLIDEFREIRRRLSDEQGGDPGRYAAMLQQVAQASTGSYVHEPLWAERSTAATMPVAAESGPGAPVKRSGL